MRFAFCFSSILFAACGGGGGDDRPDAPKVFLDSGIDAAPACAVACELKPPTTSADLCDGNNYKSISFGSMTNLIGDGLNSMGQADPQDTPEDWFITFETAPLTGRRAFSLVLNLSPTGAQASDILVLRVLKPTSGNFVTGTAIPFDPDANSATPAAYSFFFGNATILNGQIDTVDMEYWATAGSINFSSIGETTGSNVIASTTPITWSEIDMNGATVANGCTAQMGPTTGTSGFSFGLRQTMAATFQPSSNSGKTIGRGARVMSPADSKAVLDYVDTKYGHLMH